MTSTEVSIWLSSPRPPENIKSFAFAKDDAMKLVRIILNINLRISRKLPSR